MLSWFFGLFNRSFNLATSASAHVVGWSLRLSYSGVLELYAGLLGLTWFMFTKMPTGFIPQQDQGWLLVNVQTPDSSSLQLTQAVVHRLEEIALKTKGVKLTTAVCGMSILLTANSSNFGSIFVILDEFDKRRAPHLYADAIMARLRAELPRKSATRRSACSVPPPCRASAWPPASR